jgi:Protein of unknown function (DUF998)
METSGQSAGEQKVSIRLLLVGGAIGPLLYIVVFLIEGATRPHYSALYHVVSSLSLGNGGWIQTTNFIVSGALVLGFVIGLRRVLHTGRGSTWGPILLGIIGLCLIGAGIFVTDPRLGYPPGASSVTTVHGILHEIFGQLQFFSLMAVCFVLARRDAAAPFGRGWARYSVATGLLVAVFYVAFVLTGVLDGPAGLMQRICIIIGWSWIARLSIRLMSKKVPLA